MKAWRHRRQKLTDVGIDRGWKPDEDRAVGLSCKKTRDTHGIRGQARHRNIRLRSPRDFFQLDLNLVPRFRITLSPVLGAVLEGARRSSVAASDAAANLFLHAPAVDGENTWPVLGRARRARFEMGGCTQLARVWLAEDAKLMSTGVLDKLMLSQLTSVAAFCWYFFE